MDDPEQLSLFTETTQYSVTTQWDGLTREWLLPEGISNEFARSRLRAIATHLTQQDSSVDFSNHISADGRMYGMRGSELVALELIAHPTYSYPREQM